MIKIKLRKTKEILEFHYSNIMNCKNSLEDILDKKVLESEKSIKKNEETIKFKESLKDSISISEPKKKKEISKLNIEIKELQKSLNLNTKVVEMYKKLKDKIVLNEDNDFSLLTAEPKKLEEFKNEFEDEFKDILNQIYKIKNKKEVTYRGELLKSVFFYNKYDKWKAYELAKKINVSVCPYCNRSFTFVLGTDKSKSTRFEYDHFLGKATYPYLALSFYNLIPSCHICNSNLKKESPFSVDSNIHPYIEGFSKDVTFSIVPNNSKFIYGKSESYKIEFKGNKKSRKYKRASANIEVFKLEDLYNMHKDYVSNLIKMSVMYDDDLIDTLFSKYDGKLFSSKRELKNILFHNVTRESDYSKRPLSKLTTDILNEIEVRKKNDSEEYII